MQRHKPLSARLAKPDPIGRSSKKYRLSVPITRQRPAEQLTLRAKVPPELRCLDGLNGGGPLEPPISFVDRAHSAMKAVVVLVALSVVTSGSPKAMSAELSPLEQLGKQLFFDTNLSNPVGQSCASCHAPEAGFSGPDSEMNLRTGVYQGAVPGRFGNRKPPSAAYASFSPGWMYDNLDDTWSGGQFWDGRAGDLVTQAKGPFLNPLEMNNASAGDVVAKVRQSGYRPLFERVYGSAALTSAETDKAFDQIAQAIAAYESSSEVNSFSSRYDAYLARRVRLTPQEERGLKLFAGRANCTACHPHEPGEDGSPPLFTDFTYDNIGAPRNDDNPFYRAPASVNPDGQSYQDPGLGGTLNDEADWGKMKVPTLRNVAKRPYPQFVKSYLHNGTFKTLKEVVRFYNARDSQRDEFGPADVEENVNLKELGNLGLSDEEEDDVVAFLETLSDQLPISPPANPTSGKPATAVSRASFRGVRDVLRVQRFRHNVQQASGKRDNTPRR